MTVVDFSVKTMPAMENPYLQPDLVSGGCSGLAIQDHTAVVRYVASQFAPGLRPIILTRMVPIAGVPDRA
jgi:hypothetical protein